jgi:hypothetical protein
MQVNKKVLALIIVGALGIGGVMGGAFAMYLGVSDKKVNVIDLDSGQKGAVVGEIVETDWNSSDATNLQPGAKVAKNPAFVSNADYESWVIMRVDIPTYLCSMGEQDSLSEQVLMYITDDESDAIEVSAVKGLDDEGDYTTKINKDWKYLGEADSTDNYYKYYYYGYTKKVGKKDASDSTTTPLFTHFVVKDLTALATHVYTSIYVSANIIQTEGIESIDAAWEKVNNSNWIEATSSLRDTDMSTEMNNILSQSGESMLGSQGSEETQGVISILQ